MGKRPVAVRGPMGRDVPAAPLAFGLARVVLEGWHTVTTPGGGAGPCHSCGGATLQSLLRGWGAVRWGRGGQPPPNKKKFKINEKKRTIRKKTN